MLMLNEFKKNIGFFILMALVLTLLMSAGVSVFNFSFEINEEINKEIAENFDYGYELFIDEFIDPVNKKIPGVKYFTYSSYIKVLYPLPEGFPYINEETDKEEPGLVYASAYYFEDYLPKNFLKTKKEIDNFILSGSLWDNADNYKTEGKYPIFLSDKVVDILKESGKEIKVGSIISLAEFIYEHETGTLLNDAVLDFVVKGIYQFNNLDWKYQTSLPLAVIPFSAEQEYSAFLGENSRFNYTNALIDDVNGFKEFIIYAKKNNITYSSFLEKELQDISVFSSVFIVIAIVMLLVSGFIAFVYCGMLLNRRLNFIGLIKALGLSDFKIAKQFTFLLVTIFLFSFAAGNVFSFFLTSHFAYLAKTLLDYNLNIGFNWLSQALFGVLTVITALTNTVFLYKRIKRISIADILTQKE